MQRYEWAGWPEPLLDVMLRGGLSRAGMAIGTVGFAARIACERGRGLSAVRLELCDIVVALALRYGPAKAIDVETFPQLSQELRRVLPLLPADWLPLPVRRSLAIERVATAGTLRPFSVSPQVLAALGASANFVGFGSVDCGGLVCGLHRAASVDGDAVPGRVIAELHRYLAEAPAQSLWPGTGARMTLFLADAGRLAVWSQGAAVTLRPIDLARLVALQRSPARAVLQRHGLRWPALAVDWRAWRPPLATVADVMISPAVDRVSLRAQLAAAFNRRSVEIEDLLLAWLADTGEGELAAPSTSQLAELAVSLYDDHPRPLAWLAQVIAKWLPGDATAVPPELLAPSVSGREDSGCPAIAVGGEPCAREQAPLEAATLPSSLSPPQLVEATEAFRQAQANGRAAMAATSPVVLEAGSTLTVAGPGGEVLLELRVPRSA